MLDCLAAKMTLVHGTMVPTCFLDLPFYLVACGPQKQDRAILQTHGAASNKKPSKLGPQRPATTRRNRRPLSFGQGEMGRPRDCLVFHRQRYYVVIRKSRPVPFERKVKQAHGHHRPDPRKPVLLGLPKTNPCRVSEIWDSTGWISHREVERQLTIQSSELLPAASTQSWHVFGACLSLASLQFKWKQRTSLFLKYQGLPCRFSALAPTLCVLVPRFHAYTCRKHIPGAFWN